MSPTGYTNFSAERLISKDTERPVSKDAESLISKDAERFFSQDATRLVSRDATCNYNYPNDPYQRAKLLNEHKRQVEVARAELSKADKAKAMSTETANKELTNVVKLEAAKVEAKDLVDTAQKKMCGKQTNPPTLNPGVTWSTLRHHNIIPGHHHRPVPAYRNPIYPKIYQFRAHPLRADLNQRFLRVIRPCVIHVRKEVLLDLQQKTEQLRARANRRSAKNKKGQRKRCTSGSSEDEKLDENYLEKRRKNNQSAKKSRDARRAKEEAIAARAKILGEANSIIRQHNSTLWGEIQKMRHQIASVQS